MFSDKTITYSNNAAGMRKIKDQHSFKSKIKAVVVHQYANP